jgi:hypothetical protein
MAFAHKGDHALEHRRMANICRHKRRAVDIVKDEHAGRMVDDCGRNAGLVGGLAGGKLVGSADMVDGNIGTETYHATAAIVSDQIVSVGEAAKERSYLD